MKYRCLILAFPLLFSLSNCVKVTDLDDNASISACRITEVSPDAVIFNDPVVEEGSIILPMDYGKYEFPVTVTLEIRTKQTIDKILGLDEGNRLLFENESTVRKIHLIALSGVIHSYDISIEVAPRSDEAVVKSVLLKEYSPAASMISGQVVIDIVDNIIDLYALKEGSLPLTVCLDMELSEGARMEDPGKEHTFVINAYDKAIPFTVIAESGKKEIWHIRLRGVTLIEDMSQTDRETWERMSPLGPYQILLEPKELQLIGILCDGVNSRFVTTVRNNEIPFPWNVRFGFDLAPYILTINLFSEEHLVIDGWDDIRTFYLVDILSLCARAWELNWDRWLNPAGLVKSFSISQYRSLNDEIRLGQPVIDTLHSTVEIPMLEGKDFPLHITDYQMTVSDYASDDLTSDITFDSYSTILPFTVTSQSGIQRQWTLQLDPWFKTGRDILSFTVESFHSKEGLVRLESNTASIDKDNNTVTLVLKAGNDFPLVIDRFGLELSSGATLQENYAGGIRFNAIDQVIPLTVVAESGETKEWKLQLVDERIENLEAMVLDYRIVSYQGTSQTVNNILLQEKGLVDTLSRTVTLVIDDWSLKMPVTVNGIINLSKNARLQGDVTTLEHSLVFNSTDEQYHFSVTSESGTNITQWTLKLEDRSPVRLSGAEVVNFVTGGPSSGFIFDQKFLEPDTGTIVLLVHTRPSPDAQLTIKPRITVSEKARLLGITSGVQLTLSFTQPTVFKVMAEDDTVREWQIRLIYAPQVPNSSFDEWGKVDDVMNILPSNGKGWTTGNNSQLIGTNRVGGKDSPYAAEMLTQLKIVDLVMVKIRSLAAGAVLLGKFNFSVSVDAVMDPASMSALGIPFTADSNPVGFEIDYNYQSGGQRIYTEAYKKYVLGIPTPAFKDPVKISGYDKGLIATELHYYEGENWKYDLNNRPTLIAASEVLTEGTAGWSRARMVFNKVPGKENLKMTHLVVRMSSSYQGNEYKGAEGSRLTVDNFRLIYYLPGNNAIILE